ncbi:MAG TPA: SDR family oxidoreductase [Caulobacterales bacterium]|nr:SDR family oxidoreductase [Caulobacterales bacterium]
MKVLVTGIDGYIGSILGPYLMERGHDVTGFDTGYYRQGWLYPMGGPRPQVITKDLREVTVRDLEGFDAVCHLAELSNDPIGQQDPGLTHEINHGGSVRIAKAAKQAGVRRFVYTSSCSVYGANPAEAEFVDENTPPQPLTAYAECKTKVERDVAPMADANFAPCFLRNATAYGASPRQRFDIVLNDFCGLAWTTKKIKLNSDGSAWRPLVHIEDISQAVYLALKAPEDVIRGQVFNVGSSNQNYRAIEIAKIVAAEFGADLDIGEKSVDNRSYRVNFDKIGKLLPDYKCEWTAERGARQMHDMFERIGLTDETFRSAPYTRLKMLLSHRKNGLLNDKLYWQYA